ncbi:hypothetical protein X778_19010 [Pseudomonas aeruginosa VRFPA07]|uniref:hypothetical protein n=1 Tax=Pseudomonas aeruginosa TaxID=287 RepID=UPI0003D2E948|nr:hypothetical protein X778_19010 [Pseudomonas aeruginosa VRFPA07]
MQAQPVMKCQGQAFEVQRTRRHPLIEQVIRQIQDDRGFLGQILNDGLQRPADEICHFVLIRISIAASFTKAVGRTAIRQGDGNLQTLEHVLAGPPDGQPQIRRERQQLHPGLRPVQVLLRRLGEPPYAPLTFHSLNHPEPLEGLLRPADLAALEIVQLAGSPDRNLDLQLGWSDAGCRAHRAIELLVRQLDIRIFLIGRDDMGEKVELHENILGKGSFREY